jgi:hypothetical protein
MRMREEMMILSPILQIRNQIRMLIKKKKKTNSTVGDRL